MTVDISTFDELLVAARSQPQPQRLLFVFAEAGLPEDATAGQRARFEAGEGGSLTPVICVDKTPDELSTFAALAGEARQFGTQWAIVFAAGLAGLGGRAPTSEEAGRQLDRMVESIKAGSIGSFMSFDREGEAMLLD